MKNQRIESTLDKQFLSIIFLKKETREQKMGALAYPD